MFKLKTICFLTVSIMLTAHIAYAETLTVGSHAIRYSAPEGYIEVNKIDNKNETDDHYVLLFTELYKSARSSFVSLFMKKEYHEILDSNKPLVEYATIFYINAFADTFLSDADFLLLKKEIKSTFSQVDTMDSNGINITVSDQTVLKDESTIFSFSHISVNNDEQTNAVFTVTTMVNIEGTVLSIAYTRQIESQADIDATLSKSDFFFNNLNLKPVKSRRPAPGATSAVDGLNQVAGPLLLILVGVTSVMMLVLGVLFFFQNRNKEK